MAGISLYLAFLGSKRRIYMVCKPGHYVHKLSLTRYFIIGNGGLYQMPCAIEFMAFLQICPSFIRFFNNKIGV